MSEKKRIFRKLISWLLTISMVAGMASFYPEMAFADDSVQRVAFSLADGSGIDLKLSEVKAGQEEEQEPYAADEVVRISIVLEDESTIEAGFPTSGIALNRRAVAYRNSLKQE